MERIIVQRVSKAFRIGGVKRQSALEKITSSFSGNAPRQTLQALDNVSFSADAGEIVGVVGKNGAGKSTLLRIIAGIMEKDAGMITTIGKIVPAIHLETGVKDRLTMRENVHLLCTFLGYGKAEKKKTFDAIVDYAGLPTFVDTKWYQFSDGMKQRAAFAAVIHARPDILLLDEIFAAGDEEFKHKSLRKVRELAAGGATILLSGHNLPIIEEFCGRVLWIENGALRMDGESRRVIDAYIQHSTDTDPTKRSVAP